MTRVATEAELEEMSNEADEWMISFAQKYKIDFLSMSAIMVARMKRVALDIGCVDDFERVMDYASKPVEEEKVVH